MCDWQFYITDTYLDHNKPFQEKEPLVFIIALHYPVP